MNVGSKSGDFFSDLLFETAQNSNLNYHYGNRKGYAESCNPYDRFGKRAVLFFEQSFGYEKFKIHRCKVTAFLSLSALWQIKKVFTILKSIIPCWLSKVSSLNIEIAITPKNQR